MVKIVVNPGRRVWVRGEGREAGEGEVIDVKDVEAKILKFRGMADYAPAEAPVPPTPTPPPPPPPAPEPPPPAAEAPPWSSEDEPPRQRRQYRRRDLRPEGEE